MFGNTTRPLGTHHLVHLELKSIVAAQPFDRPREIFCLQLQKASRSLRLNLIGQGYFSLEKCQRFGEKR
jgi:hypothetical protein